MNYFHEIKYHSYQFLCVPTIIYDKSISPGRSTILLQLEKKYYFAWNN